MSRSLMVVAVLLVVGCGRLGEDERVHAGRAALSAPRLAADLNQVLDPEPSSSPLLFAPFGDAGVVFYGPAHLYFSDGTDAGARLLSRLNPTGASWSLEKDVWPVSWGGRVFYPARKLSGERNGLWMIDPATERFTELVTNWWAPPVELNGALHLFGTTTLDRLDAGASQSAALGTLPCGSPTEVSSGPTRMFFICSNRGQIYASDGRIAGTQRLTTTSGPWSSLVQLGDVAWFVRNGTELWRSDGTPGGTALAQTLSSTTSQLIVHGGRVLIRQGNALARVDETTVTSLPGGCVASNVGKLPGGAMAYECRDGGLSQLRGLDPADGGTWPIFDAPANWFDELHFIDDRLFVLSNNTAARTKLWVTDGTDAGTRTFRDGLRFPGGTFERHGLQLTRSGDQYFFSAALADAGASDFELWAAPVADPGAARLVANIFRPESSSSPDALRPWGDRLALRARTPTSGRELMVLGADGGVVTYVVTPTSLDQINRPLFEFQGRLYGSTVISSSTQALFSVGGEPGDLVRYDIPSNIAGAGTVDIGDVAANESGVFATVSTSTPHRWELAVIRGGDAGLQRIASLDQRTFPGACCFTTTRDEVFFPTRGADGGHHLWRSDGTVAGTRAFFGPFNNGVSDVTFVHWLDGAAYFSNFRGELVRVEADGGTSVPFIGQVAEVDGTGAWLTGRLPTGSGSSLFRMEGGALRPVVSGVSGRIRTLGTWKGWLLYTCSGQYCVADPSTGDVRTLGAGLTQPSAPSGGPVHGALAGGQFFLAGETASSGSELWVISEPTAAPVLAAELRPGAESSGVSEIVALGDRVYFNANDGSGRGSELWALDVEPYDAGVGPTGGGAGATGGGSGATGGGSGATGGGSGATGGGLGATGGGAGEVGGGGEAGGGAATGGDGEATAPVGCGCGVAPPAFLLGAWLVLLRRRARG